MPEHVVSAKDRYFSVLRATDAREFEDRVVREIELALAGRAVASVPIRLSRVVSDFLIEPRPELVNINHDGEINYDGVKRRFVIKMRRPGEELSLGEIGAQPRYRFTYAHEVAHRFFFVKQEDTWWRALDCATAGLETAAKLREKITLSRIEERLCNSIAGRILIPEEFIRSRCELNAWVARGPGFFSAFTAAARECGVSCDVLLVELVKTSRRLSSSTCVMIVGSSAGSWATRGRYVLRVTSASMPQNVDGQDVGFYPNIQVEDLGQEMLALVANALAERSRMAGKVQVRFHIGEHAARGIDGWWHSLGRGEKRRIIIWGMLN